MTATKPPSKEAVRDWLKQQIAAKKPPPSNEEIRRQLWHPDFLNNTSAECAR
jgi:hypothetical protein